MASTDAALAQGLRLESLHGRDVDGAQALVAESGWNQVGADWQLFVDLGAAFKVTDETGAVIATVATLPYAGFGWVSMVLVARSHRRQGIATALLEHGITLLRGQGLIPVLDATPAGRTVYQPLGFRDGWSLTRWHRGAHAVPWPAHGAAIVRPLREDDWPQVLALDLQAFGADRAEVLRLLAARSRGFACVRESAGRVEGFLLGRDGRLATQVGPVVVTAPGNGAEQAASLLAHAHARIEGPVLIDVLDAHAALRPQLTAAGFEVERGYTRMALHDSAGFGDTHRMVAIAGPELG